MSIQLTPEELSRLNRQKRLAEETDAWRKQMSNKLADEKIVRKNVSNGQKVKRIQKQASRAARKIVVAVEKGYKF